MIVTLLAAANRDPPVFDDPHDLDVTGPIPLGTCRFRVAGLLPGCRPGPRRG